MTLFSLRHRGGDVFLDFPTGRRTPLWRSTARSSATGPWTTARPGGTSRSSRGGATGSWRWRWTFQNKRRRYSHEGRRDTGRRRPLPDIGAMRDTGRSPLHLLLDDRASRDGACGSDRRRRARGPARRPRTLRRQEDQGRPGKEGASPRPGDASATSCANRA